MLCRNNEIKIFYRSKDGVNLELDKSLEGLLNTLGYRRWASGRDLTNGIRDLAFEKIGHKDSSQNMPDYV